MIKEFRKAARSPNALSAVDQSDLVRANHRTQASLRLSEAKSAPNLSDMSDEDVYNNMHQTSWD